MFPFDIEVLREELEKLEKESYKEEFWKDTEEGAKDHAKDQQSKEPD